jgi:nicotinamidase/pyrazinamidase
MAAISIARETDILGLVDVQPTFMPGGELPVPDGEAVVPIINRLLANFDHAFATQDWHPPGHSSFASTHPSRAPYETVRMPYGDQVLWPDHALQGSANAALHGGLDAAKVEVIIRRGSTLRSTAIRHSSRTTAARRPGWTAGCVSAGSGAFSWPGWRSISASHGRLRMRCGSATR